MKKFKYCTEDQYQRAFENYFSGGKTNNIYVLLHDDGAVETFEVIDGQSFQMTFNTHEEMCEWFARSGAPLIKDIEIGVQDKLF